MKKVIFLIMAVVFSSVIFQGCSGQLNSTEYLRIHIRANSNSLEDQQIKYRIKEEVLNYLTPLIAECSDKKEMQAVIRRNIPQINAIANNVLATNGLIYATQSCVTNEYFPTRTYGDTTLSEGFYDALIVNLGAAEGDNWWCVVYPPLCFVNATEINGENFRYKSKIVELINKFKR